MQAGTRFAALAAAVLAFVPPVAGLGHADPADPPRTCTVPADPTGMFLVMYGSTPAVPAAPIGDSMTLVRFLEPGQLEYTVVGSGAWHRSAYAQSSPEPGVAVFSAAQPTADGPFGYWLTLSCRTNDTGDYAYTTPGAAPVSSDNTAVYRFTHGAR